jgi:hypothetical protein
MSGYVLEEVPVEELKEGDLVDLLNDRYADPFGHSGTESDPDDGSDEARHMALEDEYATVEGLEIETPDCTVVYTNLASQGFPHGYKIKRVKPGTAGR